jgi:hypothetical protein
MLDLAVTPAPDDYEVLGVSRSADDEAQLDFNDDDPRVLVGGNDVGPTAARIKHGAAAPILLPVAERPGRSANAAL